MFVLFSYKQKVLAVALTIITAISRTPLYPFCILIKIVFSETLIIMGATPMQHRLLTGCFAARLCSTNWKPGSSGRSRRCSSLKMRVNNSDPSSFIQLLLLILKIVLSISPILQVFSTGASEPAHTTSYSSWDKVKWNDGDMVVLMMGSKDENM